MKRSKPQPEISRLVIVPRDGIPMATAEKYAMAVMKCGLVSVTAGRKHRPHHTEFKDGICVDVICKSQSHTEYFTVFNINHKQALPILP